MDNKLLEKCIETILRDANEKGQDVIKIARALSIFHEVISEDKEMFEGYKTYTRVSNLYYGKLEDLGIIDKEDDV